MEQVEEGEADLRRLSTEDERHRSRRTEEGKAEPNRRHCPRCSAPLKPLCAKMESPHRAAPDEPIAAGRRGLKPPR